MPRSMQTSEMLIPNFFLAMPLIPFLRFYYCCFFHLQYSSCSHFLTPLVLFFSIPRTPITPFPRTLNLLLSNLRRHLVLSCSSRSSSSFSLPLPFLRLSLFPCILFQFYSFPPPPLIPMSIRTTITKRST